MKTRIGHWIAIGIALATANVTPAAASPRPADAAAAASAAAGVNAPAETTTPARHFESSVLHVTVTGRGRPIVFIPGLATPGAVYDDAVARYAGRYECHVVTLGGFGGAPRFEGPFLETARESLLAYIGARHLESPIVVGHSLGGVLALEIAIAAPERIGPVVVLDAVPFLGGLGNPDATPETARAQFEPMRAMIASQTQEQYAAFQRHAPYLKSMVTGEADLARVTEWAATSDPRTVADGMMDVATTDLRASLAGLASRLLVLSSWYGLKDVSTREAVEKNYRDQYAAAPRFTFATADSARHFLMLDAPDWTWSAVDAFLAADGRESTAQRGGR